jgi:hypothetical protein
MTRVPRQLSPRFCCATLTARSVQMRGVRMRGVGMCESRICQPDVAAKMAPPYSAGPRQLACFARRNSSSRRGILSTTRVSSRTFHGTDLRNSIVPALLISKMVKPRGRIFMRHSEAAAGSVSTITTISRSINTSGRPSKIAICSSKRGLMGLSAKTTTSRFFQIKSDGETVVASMGRKAGASTPANGAVVWATAAWANASVSSVINIFIPVDIGVAVAEAKPLCRQNEQLCAINVLLKGWWA